jgi:Uma2 family endonuclease
LLPSSPLTIEEYERLDEPDEWRTELVRGVVVREPRPAPYHARTQTRLAHRLEEFVEREKLGFVLTDVGVILSRHPPTVRGPDVAFYRVERLPELPRRFPDIAPDLVIEIVSPSNTVTEIVEKVMDYLDAGSRLVWVVDPMSRTATVYRSRDEIRILTDRETLDGADVLPGLKLRLEDVLP